MTEVGEELQESELLQAGDISRCPFLQGIREMLGDEAVHEYLQGLGGAAAAEKRAMYEKSEPAHEPAEQPTEPELSRSAERAVDHMPKVFRHAQALDREAEVSPEQLPLNRTDVTEAAWRPADTRIPLAAALHLSHDRSAGEAEPVEIAVAAAKTTMPTSVSEEMEHALALLTGLESERNTAEQANQTMTLKPVAETRAELLEVPAVSRREAKAAVVAKAVDGVEIAEATAEKAGSLVAVRTAEEPRAVEEPLTVPAVALDEMIPQVLGYEPEERLAEEVVEPELLPSFSKRLEAVITQTVEPEHRVDAAAMVARVYELITPEPVSETAGARDGVEAGPPDQPRELERAVERLLQTLGAAAPTEQQVQRFAWLVRQEIQERAVEPQASYWLDEGMHERLQALTAAAGSWWPALAHRLLGRLALLHPASVTQ